MKNYVIERHEEAERHPEDIPDEVYEIWCSVLNRCVRLALADPVKRAEYEGWKKERQEVNTPM